MSKQGFAVGLGAQGGGCHSGLEVVDGVRRINLSHPSPSSGFFGGVGYSFNILICIV